MELPPSGTREQRINDVFVELTAAAARGDDLIGLYELLTDRYVELLGGSLAGLLLTDGHDALQLAAASSMATRDLEVLQVQRTEGPFRDCFLTGRRVLADDLAEHAHRWPRFVPAALEADFRSVHVVPVRLRSRTLGALGLFSGERGAPEDRELRLAQGLADLASVALTRDQDGDDVTARLRAALDGRVVIEQAKGFLAQRERLTITQASDALHAFARRHDLRLSEVAGAVLTRSIPAAELVGDTDPRP